MKNIKKGIKIFSEIMLSLILIGITTACICGVVFANYINDHLVPISDVDVASITLNLTSKVYAENKETGEYFELETLHGGENRVEVDLADIPLDLQHAFIAIEDDDFYEHNGVDWKRTIGAALNWVLPLGDSYGGSTITQQLIKNATGNNDFKVTRKLTEVLSALNVEEKLEKDEILELYLNTIYFGRSAYGVSTAATTYFAKDLSELNLAECAAIAGITNNPSLYDPFRFPENVKSRQETILFEMHRQGYISTSEYEDALDYEMVYAFEEYVNDLATTQSYFVDALVDQILDDLVDQKGYSETTAANLLYSGGLNIHATVDTSVQTHMEAVFKNEENYPTITGKNGDLPEAAMVVIDNSTGYVAGLVGGRGEKEGARVLNRVNSPRQPGSSIKPLAVYAPAFEAGLITPISVLDDSPIEFTTSITGWPKNVDRVYSGRETITNAVRVSTNTIAAKVLQMYGVTNSYNFLESSFGFTTLVEADTHGLAALSLGGMTQGVTVLEMTAAYTAIANDGNYIEPILYTHITDSNGEIILDNRVNESTLIFNNPNTVHYTRQVLSNVVNAAGGTAYGYKVPNMETYGKTGTTDSRHDLWFAGSTPYYTAVTWMGYDNPEALETYSGTKNLWQDVMNPIHEGLEAKSFPDPTDFVSVSYCLDSGLLPSEYCAHDVRGSRVASGYIAASDIPTETCTMHAPIPIDITNGAIANEYCPPELVDERVLLDLTRLFEGSVYLTDEQWTVSYNNPPIGEGVPALRSPGGTPTTYTGLPCEDHTEETALLDPEGGLDPEGNPLNPEDPLNPTNPEGETDPDEVPPTDGDNIPEEETDSTETPEVNPEANPEDNSDAFESDNAVPATDTEN